MESIGLGALLLALKWVFIGLIYLVLVVILLAVRREMALHHLHGRASGAVDSGSGLPGWLRVVDAGGDPHLRGGAILSLGPVTHLGSERDNDIVLQDRFVSAHHARLQWDGVDWWLTDLDSRNGTYLDGGRVAPGTPQRVPLGGSLRIGAAVFELQE